MITQPISGLYIFRMRERGILPHATKLLEATRHRSTQYSRPKEPRPRKSYTKSEKDGPFDMKKYQANRRKENIAMGLTARGYERKRK